MLPDYMFEFTVSATRKMHLGTSLQSDLDKCERVFAACVCSHTVCGLTRCELTTSFVVVQPSKSTYSK